MSRNNNSRSRNRAKNHRERLLQSQRSGQTPSQAEREATHFRLCHFCFFLNESPTEIVKCDRCSHYLTAELLGMPLPKIAKTPQDEFEEDEEARREAELDDDKQEREHGPERVVAHPRRRSPRITGLSVEW